MDTLAPCHDGAGVVLQLVHDEDPRTGTVALADMRIVRYAQDEATTSLVTGWEDLGMGPGHFVPFEASISGGRYYWFGFDGSVYAVPVEGGELEHVTDLGLPNPLPYDMKLSLTGSILHTVRPVAGGLVHETLDITTGTPGR